MFDPRDVSPIRTLDAATLAAIPGAEDDLFEYKSSRIADGALSNAIKVAASAFWNSGGGFLVIGVNNSGDPDGGIADPVGRQSRRDWVDAILAALQPRGLYAIATINTIASRGTLDPEKIVLVIGFQESGEVPFMAHDGRYYLRSGAHSSPAGHFLVESLRARRVATSPVLRAMFELDERNPFFLNLAVANLSNAAAFDIRVTATPAPPLFMQLFNGSLVERRFVAAGATEVLRWSMMDRNTNEWFLGTTDYTVKLEYRDGLGRSYCEESTMNILAEMGKKTLNTDMLRLIAESLSGIKLQAEFIAQSLAKNKTG